MSNLFVLCLNIIGGLALFLYGLKLLSQSLQKVSSEKLKSFFEIITKNKITGILFGGAVTSILQSSSATTVIMIGFANAGIIGLVQCISIIFGANIGTTITAQIIAFKASNIALPLIGIGGISMILVKNKTLKNTGEVLIGLGILFLGLKQLGMFLKPLKELPAFSEFLVTFGTFPLLGVIAGTIVTMILQSSSATTAMIIMLASTGLINFQSAFALELGSNIGTTITAQIAAFGTNLTAKRAAWAHTLFNVIGSAYMLILLYIPFHGRPIFLEFINMLTPGDVFNGENLARHCANAHTFFNIFNAIVLFPFINQLASLTEKIVPGQDAFTSIKQFIDTRMVTSPSIAIVQAKKEVQNMAIIAKDMTRSTYQVIFRQKNKNIKEIESYENTLNDLQSRIIKFLVKLNSKNLSSHDSRKTTAIIHLSRRLERIGDHNIAIVSRYSSIIGSYKELDKDTKLFFTNMSKNIQAMFSLILDSFETARNLEGRMNSLENKGSKMEESFRRTVLSKVQNNEIPYELGIQFVEIIDHLDRIGHHLFKIMVDLHHLNREE